MKSFSQIAFMAGFKSNVKDYLQIQEMAGDLDFRFYFGLGVLQRRKIDLEVLARHQSLVGKMYPSFENAKAYTDLLESYGIGIPVNVDTFKLLVVNELETNEYPGCCGPHLFEFLLARKELDFYQKFLIAATLMVGLTALEEMMSAEQAVKELMSEH
jgi:hypothetical protein